MLAAERALILKFAMDVKIMEADPRVREDIGKVAVDTRPHGILSGGG